MTRDEVVFGGLSNPSKMPFGSFGLPAWLCGTGSKLRKIVGSVCFFCFAMAGRYVMPNVKAAQHRRELLLIQAMLDPVKREEWIAAFVRILTRRAVPLFRWHDSGDIRNVQHLLMICEIARRTPKTLHWLPTKESGIYKEFLRLGHTVPRNLRVRVSAAMIDAVPPASVKYGSMVYRDEAAVPKGAVKCPIYSKPELAAANCADAGCSACWKGTKLVAYPLH